MKSRRELLTPPNKMKILTISPLLVEYAFAAYVRSFFRLRNHTFSVFQDLDILSVEE